MYSTMLSRVHGDDKEVRDADVCQVHKNIPNFNIEKLTYRKFQGEGNKIPDRTIGLLAWSEDAWHPPPDMSEDEMDEVLNHPLVDPFCKDTLKTLQEKGFLEPLFTFPQSKKGSHTSRVVRPSLEFPFAIWEAKKAWERDPLRQNALKVKMILKWQQNLAKKASIEWEPLVFYFLSVGSEWKVYACHIQTSVRKTKTTYPFRLLWSGDSINQEKALQLLYLVDLIALWGQFQYKPFAAACIRTFERWSRRRSLLTTKVLELQKDITTTNFPSLQTPGICMSNVTKAYTKLRRAGTDTPFAECERQILQGIRELSFAHYFIPEKDGFIWLMHRNLHRTDLLVIRVNTGGFVLPPLIIFKSSDWDSPEFGKIACEEKARMPPNVATEFRYNKERESVLQRCFGGANGYCTEPEIQFCAILPLKRKLNSKTCLEDYNGFHALEELLDLPNLIDAAHTENKLWCTCRQPESDSMILCDNTGCEIGWYHKRCAGLKEDAKDEIWMCCSCKNHLISGNRFNLSKYDNEEEFGAETLARSDVRIQRVRSLRRAWNQHLWPDHCEVRKLMYKKICCEIEMETREHKFHNTVERLEQDGRLPALRCWAVVRDNPQKMTHIRERFRESGVS